MCENLCLSTFTSFQSCMEVKIQNSMRSCLCICLKLLKLQYLAIYLYHLMLFIPTITLLEFKSFPGAYLNLIGFLAYNSYNVANSIKSFLHDCGLSCPSVLYRIWNHAIWVFLILPIVEYSLPQTVTDRLDLSLEHDSIFYKLGAYGLISFSDYIFLLTVLSSELNDYLLINCIYSKPSYFLLFQLLVATLKLRSVCSTWTATVTWIAKSLKR